MELKLQDMAGCSIGGISCKCAIGMTCGEHIHAEVELDDLVHCKIGLSVLNGFQLERLESVNPKGLRRHPHRDHRSRSQTQRNRRQGRDGCRRRGSRTGRRMNGRNRNCRCCGSRENQTGDYPWTRRNHHHLSRKNGSWDHRRWDVTSSLSR
jgi:hypothetical protein